tara:strand:+ start:2332 stop:2583 length:252 start_codon:yes stop_codon:yes gene_type:complete
MTREPTEMELRVAKAICNVSNRAPWADENYDLFLDEARAAIRAMREPTTKMLREAGMDGVCSTEDVAFMWGEMIDAASPPEDK